MRRLSVVVLTVGAALAAIAFAGEAGADFNLIVDRVIETTPFVNSTVSLEDGEGMTHVPVNDTIWLGDDSADRIYEVDRLSGNLLSFITKSQLANAVQFGGTTLAGIDRARDIEALAYDAGSDVLYVFSTDCCPSPPTAFRLVRGSPTEAFQVETYQPLPAGFSFTGAGFHPTEGLYVSGGDDIRPYDYVTNTLGPPLPIDPQVEGNIFGIDFSADGHDLWIVTSADKVYRLDWASKTVVPGHAFDLLPFGITDARAVDFINGQVYVLDGAGDLSLTVFNIGEGPAPPSGLTATAGSGRIDLAWTDNSVNETGVEIQRCVGTVATTCGVDSNFAPIATVGPNVTAYADLDPVDGETFTYRARAFNASGFSSYSNLATTTAGPPAAPSNLTATAVSGSRINLQWADGSDNESGFAIERCVGLAVSCGDLGYGEVATVGVGVTTYADVGLAAETTYSYRVRAFNNAGDSAAAGPAEATTLPPGNLLANPSFEEDANGDGKPDGWSTSSAFTRTSEVVRSGLFAGKHFATNDAQYSIKQPVAVSPGTAYMFTGCANIPVSADVFDFRFQLRWLDSIGGVIGQKTLKGYTTHTGGAWDCVLATGLVAPAGAVHAEVRMVAKSLSLTIYVDDLLFEVE